MGHKRIDETMLYVQFAEVHMRPVPEAAFAMRDPFSQDFDDGLQPANLVTLAAAPSGRILFIVTTESDHRIRIISARDVTRHERRLYEEAE